MIGLEGAMALTARVGEGLVALSGGDAPSANGGAFAALLDGMGFSAAAGDADADGTGGDALDDARDANAKDLGTAIAILHPWLPERQGATWPSTEHGEGELPAPDDRAAAAPIVAAQADGPLLHVADGNTIGAAAMSAHPSRSETATATPLSPVAQNLLSSAMTPSTNSAEPPPVPAQVARAIAEVSPGQTLHLSLEPATLGRIVVTLSQDAQHLLLVADHADTAALLKNRESALTADWSARTGTPPVVEIQTASPRERAEPPRHDAYAEGRRASFDAPRDGFAATQDQRSKQRPLARPARDAGSARHVGHMPAELPPPSPLRGRFA